MKVVASGTTSRERRWLPDFNSALQLGRRIEGYFEKLYRLL